MKRFSKLFITLAVCLGLTAMFTSCSAIFDIAFNGPSKLVISDDIGEADVYVDIDIYEYDIYKNCRTAHVVSQSEVYLKRGSSKVINIYNKISTYGCYQVVIKTSNGRHSVSYTSGSGSYDYRHCNVFIASPGKNYKMRLVDYYNSGFYFRLDEIEK